MGPIVCATRGGEASRRAQEEAIALARERGTRLIFFFVADNSFAKPNNEALAKALDEELALLGRTMLYIARSRAQKQEVSADTAVRHGAVSQAVEDFIREVDATTLVLGAPKDRSGSPAFGPGKVSKFADQIRETTGVEVVVVE